MMSNIPKRQSSKSTIDLGVGRLLRDVGKIGARNLRLSQDFYSLAPERERKIREVLKWRYDSYSRTALTCMELLYGMDGNPVHTYSECAEHEDLRDYGARGLRELIEQELRVLATYLVPIYARETFRTADKITLGYLQLKTRNYNLLDREGYATVADLILETSEDLLLIVGAGEALVADVERGLKWCGFHLA